MQITVPKEGFNMKNLYGEFLTLREPSEPTYKRAKKKTFEEKHCAYNA